MRPPFYWSLIQTCLYTLLHNITLPDTMTEPLEIYNPTKIQKVQNRINALKGNVNQILDILRGMMNSSNACTSSQLLPTINQNTNSSSQNNIPGSQTQKPFVPSKNNQNTFYTRSRFPIITTSYPRPQYAPI